MGPPFRGDRTRGRSGPSDEFLAIDAASEERSFSVLYDRYADALYRFFLGATCDQVAAGRLMDEFVADLPQALHRFVAGERTFAGWLFSQVSRRIERQQYSAFRLLRQARGVFTQGRRGSRDAGDSADGRDLERAMNGLRELPLLERQVLVLLSVIELEPTQVSEAIGLPTLAVSNRMGTASSTLSGHLEMESPADARELVVSSLGRVTLPDRQRDRHRRMIGASFGEDDVQESATGSLAKQLAVLAAVVVVGFVGLLGWDYVATQLSEEPPAEESAADADDRIGSAPTAGVTQTPSPSDAVAAEADVSAEPCPAQDRMALIDRFVGHMNDGEFDELRAMLPESSDARPSATSSVLDDVSEIRTLIPFDSDEYNPDLLIERLERQYEAGDRWTIRDAVPAEDYPDWFGASPLGPYEDWVADQPGLGLVMVNEIVLDSESSSPPLRGPAVVNCADEQIVAWGVEAGPPRVSEPIDSLDFIFSTTSLNLGEERVWQVRAQTGFRGDGGGMRTWDLEWRQAIDEDGTLLQRGTVYTPGGEEIIDYRHDGERWRLEQRGWTRVGTDADVPFPEEIVQVVPWLNRSAGVMHLHSDELTSGDTRQIVSEEIDLSRSNAMHAAAYSEPEAERTFTLQIADGAVTGAQLREAPSSGDEYFRPAIHFVSVERRRELDPDQYQFMFYPRYLDEDTSVPRYPISNVETEQLTMESASYADDGSREEYQIRWNDVPLTLTVTPSHGGIDWQRLSEEYDDNWRSDSEHFDRGVFQWSDNGVNGAPALALWDNGRFRFELQLEDMDPSGEDWSLGQLVELADTLSAAGSSDESSDAAAAFLRVS